MIQIVEHKSMIRFLKWKTEVVQKIFVLMDLWKKNMRKSLKRGKLLGEGQDVLKNELNINKLKIEFSHKVKTI